MVSVRRACPVYIVGKMSADKDFFSYYSHRRRRETTSATEKEVPTDIQVQRRVFECGEEECQDVGIDVRVSGAFYHPEYPPNLKF